MAKIQIQRGHEKERHLPALLKLLLLIAVIILVSVSQNVFVILTSLAILLVYLCTWPPKDIAHVLKAALVAALLALVLVFPAMLLHPSGIRNDLTLVFKVFISVSYVSIYNHTTQWNHITKALKKLHVPGIFIFTLDITLKYIVLLGNLIVDLLTSLQLRSVGKNNKKYSSIGGVMGVTFIRGTEMNRQMYEAMQCRGFTDDYEGL